MRKTICFLLAVLLIAVIAAGCSNNIKVYGKEDTEIKVARGGFFTLKLAENPTTGYTWTFAISDSAVVSSARDHFESDDKTGTLVGSGGSRMLTFMGVHKGTAEITLLYGPVYGSNVTPEKLVFKITVE